jgi:predicted HTH domain antitoxin
MAHGSEEDGDYWPGYVDALTSMVQVLAFVMMLLAMAVFVLSQSVTKSAVEAIAKAAKVDAPPDADIKQLTEKVVEALQKQQTEGEAKDAGKGERASAGQGEATQEAPDSKAAANASTPERHSATRPVSSDKPVEPSPDAKRLNLGFSSKSFRLDQASGTEMTAYIGDNKIAETKTKLIVRAYASSADGALSEARRLAYYRAMTVRRELTERKVRPEDIRINVYDTPDKAQGSLVEIFTDGTADH